LGNKRSGFLSFGENILWQKMMKMKARQDAASGAADISNQNEI